MRKPRSPSETVDQRILNSKPLENKKMRILGGGGKDRKPNGERNKVVIYGRGERLNVLLTCIEAKARYLGGPCQTALNG